MTLPKKEEKGYLQVECSERGSSIAGQSEHIYELAAIFRQRGIPCWREPSTQAGQEALRFNPDADVAAIQVVLEAYASAKGS
jgi:hypothetical protein